MSADPKAKQRLPKQATRAPSARIAALRAAWSAYTLKRAIAEVMLAPEEDYLAFGLNKHELLGQLRLLGEEIAQAPATRRVSLAISVARSPALPLESAGDCVMRLAA